MAISEDCGCRLTDFGLKLCDKHKETKPFEYVKHDKAVTFNCHLDHICENNRCFWRQRYLGVSPWAMAYVGDSPEAIKMRELVNKMKNDYGESYFPEFEVTVATNCMHLYCKDFKVEPVKSNDEVMYE